MAPKFLQEAQQRLLARQRLEAAPEAAAWRKMKMDYRAVALVLAGQNDGITSAWFRAAATGIEGALHPLNRPADEEELGSEVGFDLVTAPACAGELFSASGASARLAAETAVAAAEVAQTAVAAAACRFVGGLLLRVAEVLDAEAADIDADIDAEEEE